MEAKPLGFGARLALAFKLLFNGPLAGKLVAATDQPALPPKEPEPEPEPVVEEEAPAGPDHTAALQLLALLQREARLIDFLMEPVTDFSDAEIGAAARVVHEGSKKVLDQYFTVGPVRTEEEGTKVTLESGFDARRNALTGNVTGEPPYTGELAHPGWEASEVKLPELNEGHDARVLAPAEIEL
jgi:hypothetical protein